MPVTPRASSFVFPHPAKASAVGVWGDFLAAGSRFREPDRDRLFAALHLAALAAAARGAALEFVHLLAHHLGRAAAVLAPAALLARTGFLPRRRGLLARRALARRALACAVLLPGGGL